MSARANNDRQLEFASLLERVRPYIDDTIEKLRASEFRDDPIAGRKYSRATSIISSAYKRHGQILERALLERLKDSERFKVWREDQFKLSSESLKEFRLHQRLEKCLELRLPYGEQERAIPVDIIVFDKVDASIKSYNVKRGNGSYDAGKRRIILEELVRTNMLLFEYAKRVEHKLTSSRSHIIFYYGIRSIPEPLSLVREDLDEHFGFPVVAAIEHINEYFSTCLHDLIENE